MLNAHIRQILNTLISTDKNLYKQTLKRRYLPIFFQDWYLDTVIGESWVPYQIVNTEGDSVAVWIANSSSKLGIKYSVGPQLTPYTGLYVLKQNADIQRLMSVVKEDYSYIELPLLPSMSDVFHKTKKYGATFIIDGKKKEEEVFANMKSSWRRKIRNASKIFQIKTVSYLNYSKIIEQSFEQKGRSNPFPMSLFQSVDQSCELHDSRIILGAFDNANILRGVAYFMFDEHNTYYMGGGHIDKQNSMYLLLWEGIKKSLANQRNFDFEGSVVSSIASFFKGFGGDLHRYPILQYSNSRLVTLLVKAKKRWNQ